LTRFATGAFTESTYPLPEKYDSSLARKLNETDPAIQAGALEMEWHPWYGSAALLMTVQLHTAVQKKSLTD
jgi:hypothetical protein